MSHALTSMVEEINSASAKLSANSSSALAASSHNGGSEDPLTQIVRVLNGHLGQLQAIDSGAGQLQSQVQVAQREARNLNGQGVEGGYGGGLGGDVVGGFGRSYLGRGR